MKYWWHVTDANGQTYTVASGGVIGCIARARAEGAKEIVKIQRSEAVEPELSMSERAFIAAVTQ